MPDRAAEADILEAGGKVQRDTISPELTVALDNWVLTYGPVFLVTYSGPVTRAKLQPLTRLTALRDLTLINAKDSDPDAWVLLADLPTLVWFTAIETDISDADLVRLLGLEALRKVSLSGNSRVTRLGVDQFRQARPDVHVIFE
jgi:hypothetical protein